MRYCVKNRYFRTVRLKLPNTPWARSFGALPLSIAPVTVGSARFNRTVRNIYFVVTELKQWSEDTARLPTPSSIPHLNWNLPFSSFSVRKPNLGVL